MTTRTALSAVPGIRVGHHTDRANGTGCTVVIGPPEGMRAAAHVRGRAAGTRSLDALAPRHLVPAVNAILLTGGSAFGLGATDGVMRWLAERGDGLAVGDATVPIVPTAVIFDLAPVGRSDRWPGATEGYRACEAAGETVEEGSVGAGTGATVGKVLGAGAAMKGGVGTWATCQDDLVVAALVVANPFGDVVDASGRILAGARGSGGFVDARRHLMNGGVPNGSLARPGANTTLGVVATNARLDRAELAEVAQTATDALSLRIRPFATRFDGDIVFALSVGNVEAASLTVELLAQDALATALERAVRRAKGLGGVPGLGDE